MKLQEKTTERLEGELRGLKAINGALIGVLGALFIVCLWGLFFTEDKSGTFSALIVVPIALSAIIPLNYGNMNKIKAELKSRE
ncbi:redox-active disulfide protein 2 [Spongiimicrobium salis]|uniref:redox-active disulfide protein 2 n=1 Tax=Spongiimicrobium salis TaxID=1667022 RepID=UPI00374DC3A1